MALSYTCQVFGRNMIERKYGRVIWILITGVIVGAHGGGRILREQSGCGLADEIACD